jgi:formate/nitrite transporter FocA (FNT family)
MWCRSGVYKPFYMLTTLEKTMAGPRVATDHSHPMHGVDNYTPQWFIHNLLAATLGNIVGGGLLVGLVYWFIYLRDRRDKEP